MTDQEKPRSPEDQRGDEAFVLHTTGSGLPFGRNVEFFEALGLFWRNFANFRGRSSRGAYWWAILWYVIIAVVLNVMAQIAPIMRVAEMVFLVAAIIPSWSLTVRRLHDTGRTGWWWLIGFIPLIGVIVLLIFMLRAGQRFENRFGPDEEAGKYG